MYRPSLEDLMLKPGQVLKAKVVHPTWTLNEGVLPNDVQEQGRILLVLEERKGEQRYSTSEVLLTIVDDIRVLELVIDTLQKRLSDFINPTKWFCSDCGIPIPNPEMDKPCLGCYKILGVDVDIYCQHGLAADIACDDCGRGGFRFEGFNHGENTVSTS